LPATPETVGAWLAASGLGYALPTLRRRVAGIARAHRIARQPLDTRHPAIRETLRGIARTHGAPARRSAALTTEEVRRRVGTCGDEFAGHRVGCRRRARLHQRNPRLMPFRSDSEMAS